jgi:hypothetical protein
MKSKAFEEKEDSTYYPRLSKVIMTFVNVKKPLGLLMDGQFIPQLLIATLLISWPFSLLDILSSLILKNRKHWVLF